MAKRASVKKEKTFTFDVMSITVPDAGGRDYMPTILEVNKLPVDHFQKAIGQNVYFKAEGAEDKLVIIGRKIYSGQTVEVTEAEKTRIIEIIEPIFKGFTWVLRDAIEKAFVEKGS